MTFVCKVMLYLLAATYAETVRSVKQERSTSHHVNEWVFSQNKKIIIMTIQHHAASFKEGTARPLKASQKMLGLMAAASPVLQLGLLHIKPIQFWLKQRVPSAAWRHGRHRITVTRACVSALACWRDPFWLKRGVILDTAHRRKVVTTDASNKGWGALCEGKPTFGLWSEEESGLHINCLEMLAVCQACQFFLPDIRGHHVVIRSDSRSVVSFINHHGGLV